MPSDAERVAGRLQDILENIDFATEFVSSVRKEDFPNDRRSMYAVTRCLEIISEASRHLPETLRARYPEMEWRDIASAGNLYRHEYRKVMASVILDTVHNHLPQLRDVVLQELARLTDG
jgi:uncharacterized protein with HEPN domain